MALWRHSQTEWVQSTAAWAFARVPLLPRDECPFERDPEVAQFVEQQFKTGSPSLMPREDRRSAALAAAYYLGSPWTDDELMQRARSLRDPTTTRRLAEALGRLAELDDSEDQTAGTTVSARKPILK
jgi:hypothetical protein